MRIVAIVSKKEYLEYAGPYPHECKQCGWVYDGSYPKAMYGDYASIDNRICGDYMSIDNRISIISINRCESCGSPMVGGYITYDVEAMQRDIYLSKYVPDMFYGSKSVLYIDSGDSI